MIERLLIANRGEIARRIIRTCRRLGIETVAVFSDADADAAFVQDADVSVGIGGKAPAESYLRVEAIVEAARLTGADAVHPGYGFLAENEAFAQAVVEAGLIFVGPAPEVIAAMGSKLEAKRLMAEAGVPLLPSAELTGPMGAALAGAGLEAAAADIGFPLLVKASAGGGGRGMRIVADASALADAVSASAREAASAFGDGTVYAERYLSPSRHVEVQIFGDSSGRVVHFHERECSIQRRHQKIIEEAPSPSLDEATRAALHTAAVRAGEAIGYTSAGTVEFLLGPGSDFYFLEVNTRLQVEHPVTEAVLGIDLVELQLDVAAGGPVPDQAEIGRPVGHAIEARLYAEDPTEDYRPSTGVVGTFWVPDGVRVDGAFDESGVVTQFYDPMVAKVVAHGPSRLAAARRLASALADTLVDGIATNRELLVRTLRHPDFLGDKGDSDFLERNKPAELGRPLLEGNDLAVAAGAAALALQAQRRATDPHTRAVASGFRNVATTPQRVTLGFGPDVIHVDYLFRRGRLDRLAVDGVDLDTPELYSAGTDRVDLAVAGIRRQFDARVAGNRVAVVGPAGSAGFEVKPRFVEPGVEVAAGSTVAAMPGTVVSVDVAVGDEVAAGDVLVVMEAMKMELTVTATTPGIVSSIPVEPGQPVEAGAVLVVVDAGES